MTCLKINQKAWGFCLKIKQKLARGEEKEKGKSEKRKAKSGKRSLQAVPVVIISQHDAAIITKLQILFVQLFQVGGKPHQATLLTAVGQAEGMPQFVQTQFEEAF